MRRGKRPNYGSGIHVRPDGYVDVWRPGHPLAHADGYVPQHRLVVYEAGLLTDPRLQVHHVNGQKADNRLENLAVVSGHAHALHHAEERGWVQNQHGRFPVKAAGLRASRIDRHPEHVCALCGVTFRARADAIYCGARCRMRAFKRSRKQLA